MARWSTGVVARMTSHRIENHSGRRRGKSSELHSSVDTASTPSCARSRVANTSAEKVTGRLLEDGHERREDRLGDLLGLRARLHLLDQLLVLGGESDIG